MNNDMQRRALAARDARMALLETGNQQTLSNGRLLRLESWWNGNVSVERGQRKVFEFSREGMQPVQPVCPSLQ